MEAITSDTPREMRPLLLLCLLSTPALAHIKLTSPGNFQVTDAFGGPNKSEPCGEAGTPTGVVTTVMAGSQLTVSWTEPIPHPGHFRIGIATSTTDFRTPTAVLNSGGANCASAPVESPVNYPTLVDGLFPHTSTMAPYTTTVTVPMMSCDNCTLQLMQFMSSHAPPCFYYQCAKLRIVMPDAGQPPVDAGTGGGGGATGGGGGTTGGGGGTTGGGGGSTATGGGGGSGGTCGPASCAGCCVLGVCESGVTDAACGTGGAICSACSGATACDTGTCKPAMGCGCTSAPLGALVFAALGLLALRRSRRK